MSLKIRNAFLTVVLGVAAILVVLVSADISKSKKTKSFNDYVKMSVQSIQEAEHANKQCVKAVKFVMNQRLQMTMQGVPPETVEAKANMFCVGEASGLYVELARTHGISNKQAGDLLCIQLLLEHFAGMDRSGSPISEVIQNLDQTILKTVESACQ